MTGTLVRAATPDDGPAIGRVAMATGQDEEWSGSDPAYVEWLLANGRLLVAVRDGALAGFGATERIGSGPGAVSMLCDLFVHPGAHGQGVGQAILGELWRDEPRRMTFSSLHAHALPLYTRFGVDAWWPGLYLAGPVTRLRGLAAVGGWSVAAADPGAVALDEAGWTGVDRSADHRAWAARPNGRSARVLRDGEVLAAGTMAGSGAEYGLVHLAMSPEVTDAAAAGAVLALLASLEPPDGQARVFLPAPHPAVRPLLEAGCRVTDKDLYMASEPGLLDARRAVPSPSAA